MERTYKSYKEWDRPSRQLEYKELTPLLAEDGTLLAKGWARENVFQYDRYRVKHAMRRKEWDFYQISDGNLMLQVSFANISLGGYASAVLTDLRKGRTLLSDMAPFLGGKDRYVLPKRGDVPNFVSFRIGKALFEVNTGAERRSIRYKNGAVECHITMEIPAGLENITTVLPFSGYPDRYFMTTKQNCMPCEGFIRSGDEQWEFGRENSFCVLDWGRVGLRPCFFYNGRSDVVQVSECRLPCACADSGRNRWHSP